MTCDTPKREAADRWEARPVLSRLVTTAVVMVPIGASVAASALAAHLLRWPQSTGWRIGWWLAVLAVPALVLVVADRAARKVMPLVVLLKMTMVFPDRAPKRLAVARKAGTTRDLARRVEEAKALGLHDDVTVAAERVLGLAASLNAHDRLTRGHGERVRAVTDLIAEQLALSDADRDRLRWSALLHDIGKVAVHPDILNKPGQLDDQEWAIMRAHPLEGAKLTASLASWLGSWADSIAEHHEKYDGSGYPYGLTGAEISYGGRIVAVADCFDTMTAVRSYKKAMSPEAARRELAACAGTHFDPKVVRAFLDVSIGRLRAVAGPLVWVSSLPFVSSVPRLGQAAATLSRVGAATVAISGSVAAGGVVTHVHGPGRSGPAQVEASDNGPGNSGPTDRRTISAGPSPNPSPAGRSAAPTLANPPIGLTGGSSATTSTPGHPVGGSPSSGSSGSATTTGTTITVGTIPLRYPTPTTDISVVPTTLPPDQTPNSTPSLLPPTTTTTSTVATPTTTVPPPSTTTTTSVVQICILIICL